MRSSETAEERRNRSELICLTRRKNRYSMKPKHWFSRLPFLRLTYSRFTLSALCLLLLAGSAVARKAKKPSKALPASEQQTAPAPAGDLEAVLAKMNQSAAGFKSAQGDFEFKSYQKLTDDTDTQKGRIYFAGRKAAWMQRFKLPGPRPSRWCTKTASCRSSKRRSIR